MPSTATERAESHDKTVVGRTPEGFQGIRKKGLPPDEHASLLPAKPAKDVQVPVGDHGNSE